MKRKFRLFRRSNGGRFYLHDNHTGKQESLGTCDRSDALRLCHARNEAEHQPAVNFQIARAYLTASDAEIATRTWQTVMDEVTKTKSGTSQRRYDIAVRDRAFDFIRKLPLLQTRPEHFVKVLDAGTVSTNAYLRRFQHFALAMTWLPWPVFGKHHWPALRYGDHRAITWEEHQKIIATETNAERKAFYELAWHMGAAQGDLAALTAENIDWPYRVISFPRKKTGSLSVQRLGEGAVAILKKLPSTGPLFPKLAFMTSGKRAERFAQRCQAVGVSGVTLHSYRYAWAERAKTAGYPERFAQEALGHRSKAVHRAYARKARVELPALEDYEKLCLKSEVFAMPVQATLNTDQSEDSNKLSAVSTT